MKVLFVENHRVFAETVVAQFLADCDVTLAASVAAAEAELTTRDYDAVLVDYDLDDEKGDALVRRMREASPWPPVIGVSSHAEGNAALIEAGADAICPKMDFASIGRVLDGVCANPLIRTLALAKLEPTELVNVALAEHSTFKRVHEELERRAPSGEAARVLSDAYRSGTAPGWLVAALLGACRHESGYATARDVLLDAPRKLAESYAGPALAKIAGRGAFVDLVRILDTAPKLVSREGAAYGLSVLGSPDALDAVLSATLDRRIRWQTGGWILGRASPDEPLVLDLLAAGDGLRVRLATEIVWVCVSFTGEKPRLVTHPSKALIEALAAALESLPVAPNERAALLAWIASVSGRSPG